MISSLSDLLKRSLPRLGFTKASLVQKRHKPGYRGDFVGTELSFDADEFGFHIRGETVEARSRRMGAV